MADVIIIGGGIGGLMAAYKIMEKNPKKKVLLLEKGQDITERICPIVTKKVSVCIKCKHCAIMEGLAGAGAFSDGKYIMSTEYGGWLCDALPPSTVMSYINEADEILMNFGACTDYYSPNNELKLLCLQNNLHMQQAKLKHLGTDDNFNTMVKLINSLREKVEIITRANVTDVDKDSNEVTYSKDGESHTEKAKSIIFAVGRTGSDFLMKWCVKNKIPLQNNQVDIGVRVELPAPIWKYFSERIYEPKIWYRSRKYGDVTRMFCFNDRGHVVTENTNGILTVNGHSYKDEAKKTENSNFALLSTIRFTQPFREPIAYARSVAGLANQISGGSVLVQRLGDLRDGRRTKPEGLLKSTTIPTLDAVPGDLSLCMPKRQLDNIMETLDALSLVAKGTNNDDTLLYGIECKYYSARANSTDFEVENTKGIYAIGDGAGWTRSLSHAAANGLYVGEKLALS